MLVYMEDNQANGPDAAVEFLIEYEDVWTPWGLQTLQRRLRHLSKNIFYLGRLG